MGFHHPALFEHLKCDFYVSASLKKWSGWSSPFASQQCCILAVQLEQAEQYLCCTFVSQQSPGIKKKKKFCFHNVVRTILLLWPLSVVLWDGLISVEVGAAWCNLLCSLAGLCRSLLGQKRVAVASLQWPQPCHLWSFLAEFIEDYELWPSCTVGCCSDHLCCCKHRIWDKQAH